MDVAHLVRALVARLGPVARALLSFALLGTALFLLKQAALGLLPSAPAKLVVSIPADAGEAATRDAVDQRVLVATAWRAGWGQRDPLVRDRIVKNFRFAAGEGATETEAPLVLADRLGMPERDPIVRARLAEHARARLLAGVSLGAPGDAELERLRRELAAEVPAKVRFVQVAVSDPHVGARLASLDVEGGLALGEGSLLPARVGPSTARQIDARFGPGFAEALLAAPLGKWSGPIPSRQGAHYVWVEKRWPARPRSLKELRPRLVLAWRERRQREVLREAIDRERQRWDIEVRRTP